MVMHRDRIRYRELPDDAAAFEEVQVDIFEKPRKRRSKSVCIILALACVIALGLAASFYQGTVRRFLDNLKSSSNKEVRKALKNAGIIPDIIDDFTPSFGLSITWPSQSYHAALGNTLKPKNLQSAPEVYLTNSLPKTRSKHQPMASSIPLNNIVLTMTDPDAPSHSDPKWSEFCHWIAIGVPFVNTTAGFSAAAIFVSDVMQKSMKEVVGYKPPGPPPKTGKHRYVFLAFEPRNGTTQPLQLVGPEERRHWGTEGTGDGAKGWAEDMGLKPIAANFFYAQNDDNP